MTLWHKICHVLGWWGGRIVWKEDADGKTWYGLKCDKCDLVGSRFPASELNCPVCGYYCTGKGGHGCIHKDEMQ